ncbi:hypothetical protein DMN91_000568 [Ooceraea biroi]|uniref:Insulin-like domain-containing protein n=1 Tax=Ooceraea biroi TaxID=2015173 RepID=A0A3L8E218_OOCBI|nr:hypothetical protein DMN91_000568 [Ooceraea biroi]
MHPPRQWEGLIVPRSQHCLETVARSFLKERSKQSVPKSDVKLTVRRPLTTLMARPILFGPISPSSACQIIQKRDYESSGFDLPGSKLEDGAPRIRMFANRLNVVVTLVFAIAFLVAESGNAQVDGFPQFNTKRSSISAPQRYCGKKLSNALQIVCDGVYNSMFKKSGQEMELADYPFPYESFPFVPPERANGMLDRTSARFRRSRGIHEECCVNACTISELSSYCGP